jgi:hypothetical protein
MSVKPPLSCPPDYSIQVFRISECKKASVVKGITTMASLDLNSLNIPIQEHTEGTLLLKGNSLKTVNIDDIAIKYPLFETFNFYVDLNTYPNAIGDGTDHTYTVYNEDLTTIGTFSFTVDSNDPDYKDFPTALRTAFTNSATAVKNTVAFNNLNTVLTTGIFAVQGITAGTKYRHVFNFDTSGFGGVGPYEHPGTLTVHNEKYPDGAIKYLLLFPDYNKVDVSTCGCADASGDIKSNQKFFQYVSQKEYKEVTNPKTPIYLEAGVLGNDVITWTPAVTSHIGYHFKVGDLVSTVQNPLFRGLITDIDGYNIYLDQPLTSAMTVANQQLQHVYSPSSSRWLNVGDFLFISGATDIEDADRCYINTIILKNPHTYDIPISYMIGR